MVLVVAEHQGGQFKKATFEAITFGSRLARSIGSECVALVFGQIDNAGTLGEYGASRVLKLADSAWETFDDQASTAAIVQLASERNVQIVLLNHSSSGKALLGRVAIRWDAPSASSIRTMDVEKDHAVVSRPAFSGKAIAHYRLLGEKYVVTLMSNAIQPETSGSVCDVENVTVEAPSRQVTVKDVERIQGRVPLPEAELVVSAGRGMKDPSNWGIIEELAESLGATLACSRPVADSGWRPHHEHVGQTGLSIRPNLYLAIGISGAIQHLAGVNNSKVIVVINKDQEAPFFKAADYGVLGDLFDVVPRLTEAVKRYNAESA